MPIGLLRLVVRRLINNRALMSTTFLGLLVTVTLVTAVPQYAEGVSGLLLQRELRKQTGQAQPTSSVFIRHRDRDQPVPTDAGDYVAFDQFFRTLIPSAVGLPTTQLISYLATDQRPLLAISADTARQQGEELRRVTFGQIFTLNNLLDNVVISEGRAPTTDVGTYPIAGGESVPLAEGLMTTRGLDKWGVLVGDVVGFEFSNPATSEKNVFAVRIVGRAAPVDPESNYWLYPPRSSFDEGGVYIDREVYLNQLLDVAPFAFHEATWYADFDIDAIRAANYRRITGGLYTIRLNANAVFPGTQLENSPEPLFFAFEQKLFFLKLLLIILSAPIVAIVLYYITLAAGMVVDRQRNEIAILKSRGVGTGQVMGIYLIEGAITGGIATLVGPYLGLLVAQVIGKTFTFLVFTNRAPLPIDVTSSHFLWAGGAAALAIIATLVPALGAARHSIVTYKQQVSRSNRRPWYQRFFVDIIVLAASIYGYVTLSQRDALLTIGDGGDLFSDPLLVIVPVIFMFAIALVFLRVFPLLVSGLARVGRRFWGVAMHLGLRQISREPHQYTRLIFLLVLTLSLGTFSASMAATLDKNFDDRVLYRVGADANFLEIGEYNEDLQLWSFLPPERHLEVPQILKVARLWHSPDTSFRLPGQSLRTNVLTYAVDPLEFAQTVWWRPDFAPTPLNGLMNELARDEQALIASRAMFHDSLGMQLGDPLRVDVNGSDLEFFIAGWVDLFPTYFPQDGPMIIVNLDYLERNAGETPFNVIAHIDPETNASALRQTLLLKRFKVLDAEDARLDIAQAKDDPTRVGIFGVLSIGFLIATVLTILGFLLYSYLSFRRRMQQLGILRAMGLSVRQLVGLYAFENGFLIGLGVLLGTLLGVVTGTLFIPFLQLSADRFGDTPPFVIITAWADIAKIYILFAVVLATAFPISAWVLSKIRIHEAVKFGEEQG